MFKITKGLGTRIYPYQRHMMKVVYSLLSVPFLSVICFYIYFNFQSLIKLNRSMIAYLVAIMIISVMGVIFTKKLLVSSSLWARRFENIFKMSRFLYEHGYYYTKKRDNKDKITYPKVYLKQDKFKTYASFELGGRKFQDRFMKVSPFLEVMLFSDYADKVDSSDFVTYEFNSNASLSRIDVSEVEASHDKGIKISQDYWWNWNDLPHLLCVGTTGGGKTVFLRSLLLGIAKLGVVWIGDPKRADFVKLKSLPVFQDRIFFERTEIVEMFVRAEKIMDQRYDLINKRSDDLGHEDLAPWYEYGLEPFFILIDELNAFTESLSFQERPLFDTALNNLVLKGRQAGVFVIIAMQRPTAANIPPNVRSNMGLRVSQGNLDSSANLMAFDEINAQKNFRTITRDVLGRKIRGRGYIAEKGSLAREYYSPFYDKKVFSFYSEFKQLERKELPDFTEMNIETVVESEGTEKEEIMSENNQYTKTELMSELGLDEVTYKKFQNSLKFLSYPFMTNDKSHIVYSDDELAMFDYVYQENQKSGKAIKSLFKLYLETLGLAQEDVDRSPISEAQGIGQDGGQAESVSVIEHS